MPVPPIRAALILLVLATLALPRAGAALAIDGGVVPHQVMQAGEDGAAALPLRGRADAAGRVEARVLRGDAEAVGWTVLAETDGGAWAGQIPAVPVGGPYTLAARQLDAVGTVLAEAALGPLFVGDLWILAGQSNMQGVGNMLDVEPPNPLVGVLRMNRQWAVAEEPLHVLQESPDPVHFKPADEAERAAAIERAYARTKGAGLGLPFATELVRRTGRPIGLIATAHGGTSMDQWSPERRGEGGASLYGSMLLSLEAAGGKVRGVLWYQGESDATAEASPAYAEKFAALIAAFRADCGDPELPFYLVQLGRFTFTDADAASWNRVQQAQLDMETRFPRTAAVPAVDLALDDLIHIGTPGLKGLGHRMAKIAERDLFGGSTQNGPRLASMARADTPYGATLRVTFTGANGALRAPGRLSGFSLSSGPDGPDAMQVYHQEIADDAPDTVVLWVQTWPENAHLWHGRGTDPYCNIVDEAGMAMPAFGPVPVP